MLPQRWTDIVIPKCFLHPSPHSPICASFSSLGLWADCFLPQEAQKALVPGTCDAESHHGDLFPRCSPTGACSLPHTLTVWKWTRNVTHIYLERVLGRGIWDFLEYVTSFAAFDLHDLSRSFISSSATQGERAGFYNRFRVSLITIWVFVMKIFNKPSL